MGWGRWLCVGLQCPPPAHTALVSSVTSSASGPALRTLDLCSSQPCPIVCCSAPTSSPVTDPSVDPTATPAPSPRPSPRPNHSGMGVLGAGPGLAGLFGIICIQRKAPRGKVGGIPGLKVGGGHPHGNQKTQEGSQKLRTGGNWFPFSQLILASVYRPQPDGPAASHQHQSQILGYFS